MLRCSDGVSMAILKSELTAIYEALRAGRPPTELPPLPIQYADFAAWQRARLDGGELGAQARPKTAPPCNFSSYCSQCVAALLMECWSTSPSFTLLPVVFNVYSQQHPAFSPLYTAKKA